ncbi:hypothetical protein M3J09_008994 [Ascochyta lentis]
MQHGSQGWVHDDETAGLAQRFVAGHFWASRTSDRRFWYSAVVTSSIVGVERRGNCPRSIHL